MANELNTNYAVSVLFRFVHPETPSHPQLWEERIYLCAAGSTELAGKVIAEKLRAADSTYRAASGEPVEYCFDSVLSVFEIFDELRSGAELFSRFLGATEAKSLKQTFDLIGEK